MAESAIAIPQRVVDRIWDRVDVGDPDACWPWRLSLGSHGYGQVGWSTPAGSVMTTAHRVTWTAINGPIPGDLTIDHLCHNRPCCNPNHLRLLSRSENGRCSPTLRGEDQPTSLLTEPIVAEIRREVRRGSTYASLARSLGLSPSTVRHAALGETWAHVAEPPVTRLVDRGRNINGRRSTV